jgi:hypothetical protein
VPASIRTFFREFYFYLLVMKIVANGNLGINSMLSAPAMPYFIIQTSVFSPAMMYFVLIIRMVNVME